MSGYHWTERDIEVLTSHARVGVSVATITAAYNRSRGVHKRTAHGVTRKLTTLGIRYGFPNVTWTVDEHTFLREWAGHLPFAELRRRLIAETGIERTPEALRGELLQLGLPRGPWKHGWYTLGQAGALLGVRAATVWTWAKAGRIDAHLHGETHLVVSTEAIEALIRREPVLLDPSMMPRGRFRSIVEVDQRASGWMTSESAAALLGLHPCWLTNLCRRGDLPATRGRRGSGPLGRPRWWIRRADAMAFRAAREKVAA